MHPTAAAGFQLSSAAYERGRPGYPRAAADWLVAQVGLKPRHTVVDLAAGTGKWTRLLVPTGAAVIAVDPVLPMLATLVETVPGVRAVGGSAEAIPLSDAACQVITAAQAFHWFDGPASLREAHRVLRTDGWLALVWNRRDLEDPMHREIGRIIDPYRGDTPSHHTERWRTAFLDTRAFAASGEHALPNAQTLDVNGLIDRVTSTSFIATLEPEEKKKIVASLRALADRHNGTVHLPYRTEIELFARVE